MKGKRRKLRKLRLHIVTDGESIASAFLMRNVAEAYCDTLNRHTERIPPWYVEPRVAVILPKRRPVALQLQ